MTKGLRVLAGDVGGTKTVLSLYERITSGWREIATTTFTSAEHGGLEVPARAFLDGSGGSVAAAAIGVAGPVVDGVCRTTNLPWLIDARSLAVALGVSRVAVINDFEATARGLLELRPDQLVALQVGRRDPAGHCAVLGAGTGLGEAILVPTGDGGSRVIATEGGHTDFAPRNEVEDGLLRFLRARHPDHVSVERVVSGLGLAAIHEYVVAAGLARSAPGTLERMCDEDPGAVIGHLGSRGEDPACAYTIGLFASLYGAEAGNLALKTLPTGGLFVAGGIAPKMIDVLRRGAFLEAFLAKGRMRPVLEQIPVSIVTDPRVGMYGAAALASRLV